MATKKASGSKHAGTGSSKFGGMDLKGLQKLLCGRGRGLSPKVVEQLGGLLPSCPECQHRWREVIAQIRQGGPPPEGWPVEDEVATLHTVFNNILERYWRERLSREIAPTGTVSFDR